MNNVLPPPLCAAVNRQTDHVIVAGNGPSLCSVDYTRLPIDYDVFRCNQFYFEDKYYLGRKVKRAFFNPSVFSEQFYTAYQLSQQGDYEIEQVVLSNNLSKKAYPLVEALYDIIPDIELGYEDYLVKLDAFVKHLRILDFYEARRPTSVVYMAAVAVACGYKHIYFTGLDFYRGASVGDQYAFDNNRPNLLKIVPAFNKTVHNVRHTESCDLEMLQFLQKHYDVHFYALSESSPVAEFYPLAPVVNPNPDFKLEPKAENAIRDLQIPPYSGYKRILNQGAWRRVHDRLVRTEKYLNRNLWIRLFADLFRVPSALKHIFMQKKHRKKWWN